MSILDQLKNLEFIEDQTEVSSGAFEKKTITEGKHLTRFIGYIELGKHPQRPFKGKAKQPAQEVELLFEVFGKDNITEVTQEDGTKVVHGVLHRERLTKIVSEKSKFYKIFKKLSTGTTAKHLAELLDKVYYFTFTHNKSDDGKTTYANVYVNDAYNITPPVIDETDDEGNIIGKKSLASKCPPASVAHRLFLFNQPSTEQWKSIEIDGTYTAKVKTEDGKEVEVEKSKNFYQEKILQALDFAGSALDLLLKGLSKADTDAVVTKKAKVEQPVETVETMEVTQPAVKEALDDELAAVLGA
jgi:hypothetical protein